MSSDGYVCKEVFFAAALMYVFSEDCLTKIEVVDGERHRKDTLFHLDVPSLDAREYWADWEGKRFAITDLSAFTGIYARLTKILKQMRNDGSDCYCSPAWVRGRGN